MRIMPLLLVACTPAAIATDSGLPQPCKEATAYLGAEHDCLDGVGVCIAQGTAIACFAKCSTGPNGACGSGFHWATQATTFAEVCYCVVDS